MRANIAENMLLRSSQVWRWLKMLTGRSYYYRAQKLGKVFEPGKLKGYFNDLTAKTIWAGEVDSNGVPVNILSNRERFQFPIVITQKALGHWDLWLIYKNEKDRNEFLKLCNWLSENQDENGGWNTWQPIRRQKRLKYSAMTQSQALSVLSRAFKLTNDSTYMRIAKNAVNILLTPVEENGVTYFEDFRTQKVDKTRLTDETAVFLEEKPTEPRNTILNGWIFSLFGLYDYNLAFDSIEVKDMFVHSINTLSKHLPNYDAGYWSYYDSQRNISNPFYHNLHISQLEALSLISLNPVFEKYRCRWAALEKKFVNKKRAFIVKALEKLREQPGITIVK